MFGLELLHGYVIGKLKCGINAQSASIVYEVKLINKLSFLNRSGSKYPRTCRKTEKK